jgi:DNA-binding NarL/FixJ family response regulator
MTGQVDVVSEREYELSNLTLALERAINLIETIKNSIDYVSRSSYGVGGSIDFRSDPLIASAIEASDWPGNPIQPLRSVELKRDVRLNGVDGDTNSNKSTLTERELEVIRLIAEGLSNANIAERLFISTNTVARHIAGIFSKTESENRVQAANYTREHSLLD